MLGLSEPAYSTRSGFYFSGARVRSKIAISSSSAIGGPQASLELLAQRLELVAREKAPGDDPGVERGVEEVPRLASGHMAYEVPATVPVQDRHAEAEGRQALAINGSRQRRIQTEQVGERGILLD